MPAFQRRTGRHRLSEVLASVLTSAKTGRGGREQQVRLAWLRVCGPTWAAHGEPLGLTSEGYLRVGVWDQAWRETFFEERRALAARLRVLCPWIRGVRLEQIEPLERPRTSIPLPPPAARAETAPLAHDPPLRAVFDRLLEARDQRLRMPSAASSPVKGPEPGR